MATEHPTYVMAIDQGTTSTRAMIFDHAGTVVAVDQKEHQQIFPRAGWVEHDPAEIWNNTRSVVNGALGKANLNATHLAAVGITNQRETTVIWDAKDGTAIHNAIVWQDTRTQSICDQLAADDDKGVERFKDTTGLPLATYFAGPKMRWILDHVEGARERAEAGELMAGTMDSWLLWNLTGGPDGGVHVTDVTNASRTLLMDLHTLEWDESIAEDIGVPVAILPEIRSSSEVYGKCQPGILINVPVAGILGDQQAATFGQACLESGTAKNTYGTGNFMLLNTGEEIVPSQNGLLTTLCYQLGESKPVYALEGSIAVTGSLVQWLRDNIGLIKSADEIEELAGTVEDNGGAYIVPAFSGLFAPHWRPDARGAIVGLTRYVNKGHLARAALESTAFQTREVLDAMNADSGVPLTELKVDGGMVINDTLMQFQADLLGVDVVRPKVAETTALGAAYAAGLAVGYWDSPSEVADNWGEDKRWSPSMDKAESDRLYRQWKKAVSKTLEWVDEDTERPEPPE